MCSAEHSNVTLYRFLMQENPVSSFSKKGREVFTEKGKDSHAKNAGSSKDQMSSGISYRK